MKKIYVHLTHLGDNTFYFPNSKHIQLKNEKASRTVIDMVVAKMTNENCASKYKFALQQDFSIKRT